MRLSRNFVLSEFTKSRTAAKYGIDNSVPMSLLGNIKFLAKCLQHIRDEISIFYQRDVPFIPSSGYRSPALNKKLPGAVKESDHTRALAADFSSPYVGNRELFEWIYKNRHLFPYIKQCILEYGQWVHLAVDPSGQGRQEFLIASNNSKGKTVFEVYRG